MDALLEDQTLQAVLGRADFSGIDNAALDFSHLEDYIIEEANNNPLYFQESLIPSDGSRLTAIDNSLLPNGANETNTTILLNSDPTSIVKNLQLESAQVVTNGGVQQQLTSQDHTINSSYLTYSVVSSAAASATSSSSPNLPDSPPDSGSEPPFSPVNECDNKLVSSTSGSSVVGESVGPASNQPMSINQPQQQSTSGMENMKHFVDYSNHSHQQSQHVKLETSLNHIPHQLHQQNHPNHLSHHHPHLATAHLHQSPLDSNSQLTLLQQQDASSLNQIVSIASGQIGSISVNNGMLHSLNTVQSQSMIHPNSNHLYPGDDYLARVNSALPECSVPHYSQVASLPHSIQSSPLPPPPPPPSQQQQTQQQQQQHPLTSQSPQTPSSTHAHSQASATVQTTTSGNKKRKTSEQSKSTSSSGSGTSTTNIYIKQEPCSLSPDSALHGNGNNSCSSTNNGSNVHSTQQCDDDYFDYGPDSQMYSDSFYQCIRFTAFNPTSCCSLFDLNFKEVPPVNYRVDADKGFNFSNADEAFVCQKKNHFQVTIHIQTFVNPVYVKTPEGLQKVDNFCLHFYGVKVESPTQTIKVEQSQSDRSKKAFYPVPVELNCEQVCKMTVGRLHFSETTSNNMRKKGKPNPDQRYFYLVVSLCAHVSDQVYQIAAQASERIIVRASNPGQFENDVELVWQKGTSPETIFHNGRVGINTDRPDESLVVFGNAKVTGSIMQPSDQRAKTDIKELDTKEQLKNVANIRIVRYKFEPTFAKEVGIKSDELDGTGVLAQEVQKILPEAVKETGDIVLPNGETIEKFLVVNKDRIYMENIGAVKELCKVTDNLETRIDELERMNTKLTKFNRFDSIKSAISRSSILSSSTNTNTNTTYQSSYRSKTCRRSYHSHKACNNNNNNNNGSSHMPAVCTNRFIQTIIMVLVFIMAFCLLSIATLYILEYHRRHNHPPIVDQLLTSADNRQHQANSNSNNHNSNNYYTHDQYSVPSYHPNSNVNIDYHSGNTPSYNSPYTTNNNHNSIETYKDKKYSQHEPFLSTSQNARHPRPTAIPILKPQVLGIPFGCIDTNLASLSCPFYCCSDDNYHYNIHSNLDPPVRDNGGGKSYGKLNDYKTEIDRNNNDTENESSGDSNSSSKGTSNTTAGPIPATIIINKSVDHLNEANYFEQHSKFDSGTEPNSNKKKRTDKGLSFGKYSGSGIQDIHNMNDYHESKSSLLGKERKRRRRRRRKRRETGSKSIDMTSQNINNYPRKVLTKSVEFIKLIELNATIDYSYCTKLQCTQGVGSKFHYIIPLSKYMDLEYVTLQFSLNQEMKVDHCERKSLNPVSCHSSHYDNIPQSYKKDSQHILLPETNPHWRLPIGIYLQSSYVFRILARNVDIDSPCNLHESQTGVAFVEYKFEFVRKCDK